MNVVKIADLKNNLSRHLARVRKGGQITVYDRDTPVARIVPIGARTGRQDAMAGPGDPAVQARLSDLVRQGILSPGDPQAIGEWLEARKPVQLPAGSPGAVDVLLEMRRESTR